MKKCNDGHFERSKAQSRHEAKRRAPKGNLIENGFNRPLDPSATLRASFIRSG